MTWMDWILATLIILFGIIFFIGLRFRYPQRDWPYNRKTTLKFLGLVLIFTLLLILMNVVRNLDGWPSRITVWFYGILVGFVILIVMGIFLPRGIRLERG